MRTLRHLYELIRKLDNLLGIRQTANTDFDRGAFEFGIVDSPRDLHQLIRDKNRDNNKSRMVAGYCWDWKSKKDPNAWDIEIPEHDYRAQWNLGSDGSLWAIAIVTNRIKPMKIMGTEMHLVAIPWHYGWVWPKDGGESANLLTPSVGDANTGIPETKAFMVNVKKA